MSEKLDRGLSEAEYEAFLDAFKHPRALRFVRAIKHAQEAGNVWFSSKAHVSGCGCDFCQDAQCLLRVMETYASLLSTDLPNAPGATPSKVEWAGQRLQDRPKRPAKAAKK